MGRGLCEFRRSAGRKLNLLAAQQLPGVLGSPEYLTALPSSVTHFRMESQNYLRSFHYPNR